jgi:hypothetical protein
VLAVHGRGRALAVAQVGVETLVIAASASSHISGRWCHLRGRVRMRGRRKRLLRLLLLRPLLLLLSVAVDGGLGGLVRLLLRLKLNEYKLIRSSHCKMTTNI